MTTTDAVASEPVPFRQPKVWLRWLAVVLAVVGWWLSLQLFLASGMQPAESGLLNVLCGGADQAAAGWDCRSVLASRSGYIALSKQEGALRIPVSSLGMGYFAFVGLWYLFIGPTTLGRRAYHLLIAAVVLCGIWSSLDFIWIMAFELHQWCVGCLATHAVNGGLLVVTVAAWPWHRPSHPQRQHPTGRLALATVTAGLLAGVCHLVMIILIITGSNMKRITDAYSKIVAEPQYLLWDYGRQPPAELPLYSDEVFMGSADAPQHRSDLQRFPMPPMQQRPREAGRGRQGARRRAAHRLPLLAPGPRLQPAPELQGRRISTVVQGGPCLRGRPHRRRTASPGRHASSALQAPEQNRPRPVHRLGDRAWHGRRRV